MIICNVKLKRNATDSNYGENVERPDVPVQIYDNLMENHLSKLKVQNIYDLESETRGQASSERWRYERSLRLSSSFFKEIACRKKSTPCSKLVMRIVYGRNLCNSAMKYGLANEEIARKQYEREYSTEVKMCGLFVDKDKPFLCASPDGLVEANEEFWKGIIPKLEKFYFKCVLPEILDGRAPRNMPLKEPLYVEESSRSKKQKMIDIARKGIPGKHVTVLGVPRVEKAAHFDHNSIARKGFAKFFADNSLEEREHAHKFIDYLNSRGARFAGFDIKMPSKASWNKGLDALTDALNLEKHVNNKLHHLHDVASLQCIDQHLMDFLESEFFDEQVKSIDQLSRYISIVKGMDSPMGEYLFDQQLQG
ncbi:ferritin heavy chain A [Trichonephila clavipes]|nr:ferritin heavy chain A [Trichonephila clavipes]